MLFYRGNDAHLYRVLLAYGTAFIQMRGLSIRRHRQFYLIHFALCHCTFTYLAPLFAALMIIKIKLSYIEKSVQHLNAQAI